MPLLWASARNGLGTPPANSEISAGRMEPHNAHLKPYSLSNTEAPGKPSSPGELAQSLCSALAAVWHVHSMGRPSAASVAYSLVTGWIRSVSAFACPSERCTAPLQTRQCPQSAWPSCRKALRPALDRTNQRSRFTPQPNTGWQYRCHCISQALHSQDEHRQACAASAEAREGGARALS